MTKMQIINVDVWAQLVESIETRERPPSRLSARHVQAEIAWVRNNKEVLHTLAVIMKGTDYSIYVAKVNTHDNYLDITLMSETDSDLLIELTLFGNNTWS